ncbi:hypothetical protein Hdeb2414_s0008g00290121 [Helianthus debilis subsp. tardiflorus]
MLVDESEEEDAAEAEAEVNVEGDVRFSPESAKLLKSLTDYDAETEKTASDEGDNDGDNSSSSSSEEEIDETERAKRIKAEIEKERQLKRKRKEDKDDELYKPSPEHVIESQTSPSSSSRKKTSARKSITSPKAAKRKLIVKFLKHTSKPKLKSKPSQPPSPPPEPSPHFSPVHQSSLHLSPIYEQPVVTSQQIFQTPPYTQPPVQTTPGSSVFRNFPNILVNKLEKRVKSVEAENSLLIKKVDTDQTEIDILKVKVAVLEEEKACRDEQNKYFELKNKELVATKAMKEHEIYMMNKVLENMLGKSVEQRFEEIEVEEVRARRQAEIDAEMKFKGKGVEGDDVEEEDDEEDDDEEKVDNANDVFSASSHSDDDDDENGQGGSGVKVTEASNEQNVDDFLHDDVNEEPECAEGEGENVEDQNVDKREKLILHLEPEVEEGEIKHTYTMNDII